MTPASCKRLALLTFFFFCLISTTSSGMLLFLLSLLSNSKHLIKTQNHQFPNNIGHFCFFFFFWFVPFMLLQQEVWRVLAMVLELKMGTMHLYLKKVYQTHKTSSLWITPQQEESPQFITDGIWPRWFHQKSEIYVYTVWW